jgi:hypothetical protein
LARTKTELKGFIAIPACIELLASAPCNAYLVHFYVGAFGGFLASTHSEVFNDEVSRRVSGWNGN